MNTPRKLYKYVPPERIDILRNGHIRFTQPSSLNDPFEMQPVFEVLFHEEKVQEILEPPFEYIEESLREKYKELPADQKSKFTEDQMVALVRSNPELLNNALRRVEPFMRSFLTTFAPEAKRLISEEFDKHIGMLSLTENPENLLMWSHYAAAHKGFLIEFDATHEYFNRRRSDKDEFYYLRKVRYIDRTPSGRSLHDLSGEDLMVTKMKIWDYEREWRMLLPLNDADKVIETASENVYLYSIPAVAITGVILGAKASSGLKSEIEQTLRDLGRDIPISSASLATTSGSISIK